MTIYRKGEDQFGLWKRAVDEAIQRNAHKEEQERIITEGAEKEMIGQGSVENFVNTFDALQELREHRIRDINVLEGKHNATIQQHLNAVKQLNEDGGIELGNIKIQEELPVSGDDLARGRLLRKLGK